MTHVVEFCRMDDVFKEQNKHLFGSNKHASIWFVVHLYQFCSERNARCLAQPLSKLPTRGLRVQPQYPLRVLHLAGLSKHVAKIGKSVGTCGKMMSRKTRVGWVASRA